MLFFYMYIYIFQANAVPLVITINISPKKTSAIAFYSSSFCLFWKRFVYICLTTDTQFNYYGI